MSLEGRLRELALAEVLQLLSLGKKTGTLQLHATLTARQASIVVDGGWIVDAAESGTPHASTSPDTRSVSDRVLDMLQWTDGEFRFTAHAVPDSAGKARIPTDLLLMESARRTDAWIALRESIPGPHAIPAFVNVQPARLPLLHLAPDQWEILTRIDGVRSITELARDLRRDLVEVATTLHELIDAGVVTLVDATTDVTTPTAHTPRGAVAARPTPPSPAPTVDVQQPRVVQRTRQTIPPVYSPVMPFALPFEAGDDDSLFDPMQVGVMTPDGMPAPSNYDEMTGRVSHVARSVSQSHRQGRAGTEPADTSRRKSLEATARELLVSGDREAATGNLSQACTLWERSLALGTGGDADHAVRERIRLARRLEALLHSSTQD
jgi:predicted transcriptional regulator